LFQKVGNFIGAGGYLHKNGCYWAHCVAKGFSQTPGKDFQENHALVVSETLCTLLLSKHKQGTYKKRNHPQL
jgi:hypothetical protein